MSDKWLKEELAHKTEGERERRQSAENTLRVMLAGTPVKSPGIWAFFFPQGPAFAIWYSNAEETGGELLPDHQQYRQGLVKEHQLGQQDAGPVPVQGDERQLTHTGVSLVLPAFISFFLSPLFFPLSLTHTYTDIITLLCSHTEAATLTQWPAFLYFDSYSKTTRKFLLIFCFQSGRVRVKHWIWGQAWGDVNIPTGVSRHTSGSVKGDLFRLVIAKLW